jgi:nucleotidyltransferase/DNA polymerase involved in DNA repair
MRVACILLPDFEVAVELSRHPEMAGGPVVVGGLPHERKNVRSRSSEAAAFGIAVGMPLRKASGLCPEAVFLPPDDRLYQVAMDRVLETLDAFSPKVETSTPNTQHPTPNPLVAYLDASGLELLFGPDEELGQRIAAAVEVRTGLRPRVGIGAGKFVAYVAAMVASSGSAVVVKPGEERRFLAPLPVERIPSSGEMQRRLGLFGLRTMGQLADLPKGALGEQFGAEGVEASRLAKGIDERPVVAREIPTILREEVEIDPPTGRSDQLIAAACYLAGRLEAGMRVGYLACQEVTLDLGFADGAAVHLSTALHEPTGRADDLQRAVERLLGRVWAQLPEQMEGEAPGELPEAGEALAIPEGGPAEPPAPILPLALGEAQSPRAAGHKTLPYAVNPEDSTPRISLLRLSVSGFGSRQGEQMELFRSREAGLKKVRQTVERAEGLFGDGAIVLLAETTGEGLPARRIKVMAEVDEQPHVLFLDGRRERVREVSNRWRVQQNWWRRERIREYYRIITESGRLCLIFQDLLGGGWFIERIYD